MAVIEFLISVGAIAASITGLAAYLGRMVIQYLSKREIEKSKVQFQTQLEEFKNKLQIHSIQYSKLYDERAGIIKQLNSHFNDFYQKMLDLTLSIRNITGKSQVQVEQEEIQRIIETGESGNEFLAFYESHRIFFSKDLCSKIDEVVKLLKSSHSDISFPHTFGMPSSKMTIEMFRKAGEDVRGKGAELKEQIEDEFRSIIGTN